MITRKLPITLGVIMIVLLILLIVGWVLMAVFGALASEQAPGLYWTLLSVGSIFYLVLLVGISFYLALMVMTINLNQRQSNFIDSVTHELKSPIASMKLYLQTLNRREVSHDEQITFYSAMLDDVRRLDELVDQVLEAGRLGLSKNRSDSLEQVELAPLIRECAEIVCLRYKVPLDSINFELIENCPSSPVVYAARIDLELIFRNLIDNGVKYSGTPSRVDISMLEIPAKSKRLFSRGKPSRVSVRIADNGRGIPPQLRRKIFRRFVRLGVELTRDRPGTGLGLYIVRTLVRRLRGTIRVGSADSPFRTVFEVTLPTLPSER
jgi:signal transduction histidine kinase